METTTSMNPAPAEAIAPAQILIVDDSRAIQAIIRRVVEGIGYASLEIRVAASGRDALEQIDLRAPDLVITDWHMPNMSGIEMFQTMRQNGHRDIKVGFITTESSPELLQEARSNGAVFILNKPFRDEQLVREITAALPVEARLRSVAAPTLPPTAPTDTPTAAAVAVVDAPTPALPVITEVPLTTTAPALISEAALSELVHKTLGEIPFRLIRQEGLEVAELSARNLLGIFGHGDRAVAAVAVLDLKSICILGGGAAMLAPNVVRAAMSGGRPSEVMLENANRFMSNAAQIMQLGANPAAPVLAKSSLVPKELKKLEEVLTRSVRRVDYRVSVPGYGDGRFSFLAL